MDAQRYNPLDDLPISIRDNLSPAPSHFSHITDTPHNQQVMSPTGVTPHTPSPQQQHQQQQAPAEAPAIVFRSMAQLQVPGEIMSSLQKLASVNLEGLQDLDNLRHGVNMLASELTGRTEKLSAALAAVAQLSTTSGIRSSQRLES